MPRIHALKWPKIEMCINIKICCFTVTDSTSMFPSLYSTPLRLILLGSVQVLDLFLIQIRLYILMNGQTDSIIQPSSSCWSVRYLFTSLMMYVLQRIQGPSESLTVEEISSALGVSFPSSGWIRESLTDKTWGKLSTAECLI